MMIYLIFLLFGTAISQDFSCPSGYIGSNSNALNSGANDVIVVTQVDGSFKSTHISVQVGKFHNFWSTVWSREGTEMKIYVNGQKVETESKLLVGDSGKACFNRGHHQFSLQSQEWQNAPLRSGFNRGHFQVDALDVQIPFNVFLYDQDDHLILTDIDGTITESDVSGHVLPNFGIDAHHDHVIELFDKADNNGYKVVYLTARSIAQAESTREYLFETLQDQDGFSMPQGPVFMSPRPLAVAALAAIADPAPMKTALIKSITNTFERQANVFVGAYGNKASDAKAYVQAGIPTELIFIVDESSVMKRFSDQQVTSYRQHELLVDQMYPKL